MAPRELHIFLRGDRKGHGQGLTGLILDLAGCGRAGGDYGIAGGSAERTVGVVDHAGALFERVSANMKRWVHIGIQVGGLDEEET